AAATCSDIDECLTDNGGCGDAAFYLCTNNDGAAATCSDIDECLTDNGGCDINAACTNIPGAIATCECNNGYSGDGTIGNCEILSLYNGLIPEDFSIHSIYPNPFNPVTNIIYALPENVNVQIVVFNLSGKQIQTLVNEFQTPGYHSVSWNADNHPSGLYFVIMTAGKYINTQKLMIVK
ncbi:T9SS C-terminal target domain-containing protein, partial [Candidatus Marinimicrobia bacterium PRS2]